MNSKSRVDRLHAHLASAQQAPSSSPSPSCADEAALHAFVDRHDLDERRVLFDRICADIAEHPLDGYSRPVEEQRTMAWSRLVRLRDRLLPPADVEEAALLCPHQQYAQPSDRLAPALSRLVSSRLD